MAIEEPVFVVVMRQAPFEIRDYSARVIAEVIVHGDPGTAGSKGFRPLAGYIFGGNKTGKRIAMTAPVTIMPHGSEGGSAWLGAKSDTFAKWAVSFTMPKALPLAELPAPTNPSIQLKSLPERRFAVYRFSGLTGKTRLATETEKLLHFVASQHLTLTGSVVLARYDPPWTPWFMRRNELMVSVGSVM